MQAEPIQPPPFPGASGEYDAVASLLLQDDAFDPPPDAAEASVMAADELETFSGPIPLVSLWVNEEQLVAGDLGGVTAFLFFDEVEAARGVAEAAAGTSDLRRVVLNTRSDEGPFGPGMNTLPYHAVVEIAAQDLPGLAKAVEGDGAVRLAAADVTVVTREAVLWDRMPR